jgi:hypothetical protein
VKSVVIPGFGAFQPGRNLRQKGMHMMQEESWSQDQEQANGEQSSEGTIVGTELVVHRIQENILPLHIQKLHELPYTAAEKAELAAIYDAIPEEIKTMGNMVLEVWGAIIMEHLPFKSKKGPVMPGYFNALFLCRDPEKDSWFIAKSSSSGLTLHAMNMIALREREGKQGWYVWEEPTRYRVAIGKDNSHHFTNVDKPKVLRGRK